MKTSRITLENSFFHQSIKLSSKQIHYGYDYDLSLCTPTLYMPLYPSVHLPCTCLYPSVHLPCTCVSILVYTYLVHESLSLCTPTLYKSLYPSLHLPTTRVSILVYTYPVQESLSNCVLLPCTRVSIQVYTYLVHASLSQCTPTLYISLYSSVHLSCT